MNKSSLWSLPISSSRVEQELKIRTFIWFDVWVIISEKGQITIVRYIHACWIISWVIGINFSSDYYWYVSEEIMMAGIHTFIAAVYLDLDELLLWKDKSSFTNYRFWLWFSKLFIPKICPMFCWRLPSCSSSTITADWRKSLNLRIYYTLEHADKRDIKNNLLWRKKCSRF
jgi:hypothetical protein